MNREGKIKYLNAALSFNRAVHESATKGIKPNYAAADFFSSLPKSLFKYRCFDEFTQDMLEKKYIYLCPAEKLDDPFECIFDLDISRFYDENKPALKKAIIQTIIEMVVKFVVEDKREATRQLAYSCITPRGTIDQRKALDVAMFETNGLENVDAQVVVNQIAGILDQLNELGAQEGVEDLVKYSIEARKETGICSLSEINDSQVMWALYSGNYTGYCVEYDFENDIEAAIDTLPVIYQNKRTNNVVTAIMSMALNTMVREMSKGQLTTDETQYLQAFLTKSEEWSFQKEWRVVRGANEKVPAPRVKAIYVGHKADENNLNLIKELSFKMGFEVYKTSINPKSLTIEFIKVQ